MSEGINNIIKGPWGDPTSIKPTAMRPPNIQTKETWGGDLSADDTYKEFLTRQSSESIDKEGRWREIHNPSLQREHPAYGLASRILGQIVLESRLQAEAPFRLPESPLDHPERIEMPQRSRVHEMRVELHANPAIAEDVKNETDDIINQCWGLARKIGRGIAQSTIQHRIETKADAIFILRKLLETKAALKTGILDNRKLDYRELELATTYLQQIRDVATNLSIYDELAEFSANLEENLWQRILTGDKRAFDRAIEDFRLKLDYSK